MANSVAASLTEAGAVLSIRPRSSAVAPRPPPPPSPSPKPQPLRSAELNSSPLMALTPLATPHSQQPQTATPAPSVGLPATVLPPPIPSPLASRRTPPAPPPRVVNSSGSVFIYDSDGSLKGTWTASGVTSPTDIAVTGNDILITTANKVYRFANAAFATSGTPISTNSFALASGNTHATGIATDGTDIWLPQKPAR